MCALHWLMSLELAPVTAIIEQKPWSEQAGAASEPPAAAPLNWRAAPVEPEKPPDAPVEPLRPLPAPVEPEKPPEAPVEPEKDSELPKAELSSPMNLG